MATFAQVLPLLPLLYLVVAKLRRRQATWPGLVVGLASVIALRALDVRCRRRLPLRSPRRADLGGRRRAAAPTRPVRVQALGMLGFGALALAGLIVDPDLDGTWWRPAGSCTASGTSSTKLDRRVSPSFAGGAASSTSWSRSSWSSRWPPAANR